MFGQAMRAIRNDVREARGRLEAAARRFMPGELSGVEAVALLEELGVVCRLADGLVAKAAKRVEDTAAHTRGTDRSAAELAARVVGVSPNEAKRAIETASALESLPATDAAVRAGTLSAAAAEQIAAGAADDPTSEADLLRAAAQGMVPLRDAVIATRARREDSAARRARQRKARSHRMWTTAEGMIAGAYQLPPEEGAAFKARIDGETRRIYRDHRSSGEHEPMEAYAADALVESVTGDPTATRTKVGHTVHVVVDHSALTRGETVEGETCEIPGVGPVDVAWVREKLGRAFLTAIVKKGRDVTTVAHLGRHVPAELRTALIVGGRECVVEGCTARGYLELDHSEIDYADGGPTALWNLDWECWTHHHLKTQGWTLGPPDPHTGKRRLEPPREPPGDPPQTERAA